MVKSQIALDIFQMKALNEIGLNTKDASMAWVKINLIQRRETL